MAKKSILKDQKKEVKFFIFRLRTFLRDNPKFNELKEEPALSDNELLMVVDMTVSEYNMTAPFLNNYTLLNMLSAGLLTPCLYVAAAHSLSMRINWQERNKLSYSDGGRAASLNDKAPDYKSTLQLFLSLGTAKFQAYKTAMNLQNGYGVQSGIPSDYSFLDYYDDYNF